MLLFSLLALPALSWLAFRYFHAEGNGAAMFYMFLFFAFAFAFMALSNLLFPAVVGLSAYIYILMMVSMVIGFKVDTFKRQ